MSISRPWIMLVWLFVWSAAPPSAPTDHVELSKFWADLADGDAMRAYRAICSLALHPTEAVPFLRSRLHAVPRLDPKLIANAIARLDHDSFEEREAADRELSRYGEPVANDIRKALAGAPAPEARRRLEAILRRLEGENLSPEVLRASRAVEALESMGTGEAKRLLKELAGGAPGAESHAKPRPRSIG